MQQFFINHEAELRLGIFIVILVLMASLEGVLAFRKSATQWLRLKHVGLNFFVSLLNTLMMRLLLPSGLVGIAVLLGEKNLGLFNQFPLNPVAEIIVSIILLDLFIYWQHRFMHYIPVLWKLHGVHHSEQFMDFSTGFRFHPFEMLFSFLIKIFLVSVFGVSPLAVIIFEIMLSSFAIFSHSNVVFPEKIERVLSYVFITPALHRIHHSIVIKESNNNFGFSVNIWDRIFSSYQTVEDNQSRLVFGRMQNNTLVNSSSLPSILIEPFK
jgi:sterol desaturase/sphingolipid hydroxylase (fatty acid hydroxylase superfamily)